MEHAATATDVPVRFETATGNPRLNAAIVDADETTGRARAITRLSLSLDDLRRLAGTIDQDDEKAPAGRR